MTSWIWMGQSKRYCNSSCKSKVFYYGKLKESVQLYIRHWQTTGNSNVATQTGITYNPKVWQISKFQRKAWGFDLGELEESRPCSNCASESTSRPLTFPSFPVPLLPFPFPPVHSPSLLSLPSPPRREAVPLKPARLSGVWGAPKLPQWGSGRSPDHSCILLHCMLAKRICLQHFWFFGHHCNECDCE